MKRYQEFLLLAATATDECIVWPHSLTHDGYGRVLHGERHHYVNRLACEMAHGPGPGMEAAHSCGTHACINQRHLSWKSHADNDADKELHGTRHRGDQHPLARLTSEQVAQIRQLRAAGEKRVTLAALYGCSPNNISNITNNRSWKDK